MSIDLGRRLIAAGLVPPEEVEAALFLSVARGVPFARVLIDRGAITERGLEEELERLGGLGLRQVGGAAELVARLPRAMCRRLAALPTRLDPQTGTIDVAAADPLDPHIAVEFGFQLGAPIRVVRAPIAAIEEAIRRLELDEPEATAVRARERRKTPPFPHGAPQSSVPPPVLDETPIPLVRKVSGTYRATEPAPPPVRAEPARAHAPFTMGATGGEGTNGPHRATIRPPLAGDLRDMPLPPRDAPLPRANPEHVADYNGNTGAKARVAQAGAVSFPSSPPDALGDRHTPPYGTPALAPPAEPMALGRGARSDAPRATLMAPSAEHVVDDEPPPEPPRVVRAPDAGPILDALDRATSRDEVIRHAMRGMRLVARRIGVFAVKRDGFHGWACNVDLGDPDAFRELVVPGDQPSILATATATAIYLGRIPPTPAHELLLRVMEQTSSDVAAVAARVAGRPALMLLADELDDTLTGTRFLVDLATAVGDALGRLLASR
ncbi:Hypothetical protein A7982_02412 [Minicystis rosea]|nr:Hypothetical protein A7982_02412 [Minicystis rosea]